MFFTCNSLCNVINLAWSLQIFSATSEGNKIITVTATTVLIFSKYTDVPTITTGLLLKELDYVDSILLTEKKTQ